MRVFQPGIPDEELISRAIQGDSSAFGSLYERYLERIYRYVYFRVADAPEAEDLTETVFLKAWEALPNLREEGLNFRAWLYRIAHNLVVDRHRTQRALVPLESVVAQKDIGDGPELAAQSGEISAHLAKALSSMDEDMQQVLVCRFIMELSHAETAAIMGRSEGYVRVLQFRALRKLKDAMKETSSNE